MNRIAIEVLQNFFHRPVIAKIALIHQDLMLSVRLLLLYLLLNIPAENLQLKRLNNPTPPLEKRDHPTHDIGFITKGMGGK